MVVWKATDRGLARLSKSALGAGFGLLLVGVLAAYRSPASGYELSLLAATPTLYFLGVAVALVVSVCLSVSGVRSRPVRAGALLLGVLAVTTLVMLPVIRGYYLYIGGDSLTHLGWTRDILSGRLSPVNLLYPGLHTMSILVSELTGIRLGLTQMYVTLSFVLVYVVFIALCVRLLGRQSWATPIGVFSALMLLSNTNISTHIEGHPVTYSVLFLPFVLYLVLKYVSRDSGWDFGFDIATPSGVLLGIASVALVLIHPQGALNFIAILTAGVLLQYLARRVSERSEVANHRSLTGPTALATAAFLLWTPRHDRVGAAVGGVVEGLFAGATSAGEITQRSTSLVAVGGSVTELFVKLFLVATVFCVLAGVMSLLWASGRLDDRYPGRNTLLGYLVLALGPLTVAFILFFVANSDTMHFRYVGFIMVPATILGALALASGLDWLTGGTRSGRARVVLAVVLLLMLPLPLATIHSTPFIYKSTSGMTEMHYQGANTTFERMDRNISFAGIRSGPGRVMDGTRGTERAAASGIGGLTRRGAIPESVFGNNLTDYYDEPRYIPVTAADYQREVVLYDELRYSERGFRRLNSTSGINRVQSTGEYRLYLLGNRSSS